jgi:hypothetical protein
VGPETAILPTGWESRLIPVPVPGVDGVQGLCLEIHDLLVSKAAASRDKDLRFLSDCLRFRLANPSILLERIATLDPLGPYQASAKSCLARALGSVE